MSDKLLYDLTNSERALNSLSRFTNISTRELELYIRQNIRDEVDFTNMYFDIVNIFDIDVENLKLDDIGIKSIHVTTGNDNGESIKKKDYSIYTMLYLKILQ
ncbi:hypothetical protein [Clostridium cagae]|uniref:hypothetical protein n=1 Tax=Clostridium cagae TaxID=2080751 RepID=UPI00131A2E8A|nr:hypothetical protein [Clostridium cagae]